MSKDEQAYIEPCECDKYLGFEKPCGQYFIEGIPGLFAVHFDKEVAERIVSGWNREPEGPTCYAECNMDISNFKFEG